jgi:hypothetical protein
MASPSPKGKNADLSSNSGLLLLLLLVACMHHHNQSAIMSLKLDHE